MVARERVRGRPRDRADAAKRAEQGPRNRTGGGSMFGRLLRRSLAARKLRSAMVVLAVMVGAAIASALLTSSFSVRESMVAQFRAFGPNIVLEPGSPTIEVGLPGFSLGSITEQGYINESDLWKIKGLPERGSSILGYAPFLYQTVLAYAHGINIHAVLAGTYFSHPEPRITGGDGKAWTTGARHISGWGVNGSWVEEDCCGSGAMVGVSTAELLRLRIGSVVKVTYKDLTTGASNLRELDVTGIVTTGGVEDSMIFSDLSVAQELSSRPGMVHMVQVSALTTVASAEEIAAEIASALPSVEARSTRQLEQAESLLLGRTEMLVWLVTAAAMGASALGVMATMTTGVLERRREIGIMKALGAGGRKVASLLLAESVLLGAAGGFAGYFVGLVLVRTIGAGLLGRTDAIIPAVLPITVALSVLAALAASALPVWRALRVPAAEVLRGD